MEAYLDNAATSRRKPDCVYEAMDRFMRDIGASPGRSVHRPGVEASRVVMRARENMARLLGVADASRIVFTLNCTEALNLALKGIVKEGGHVVTTGIEHNSVMRPLSALVRSRGIEITRASADSTGFTHPSGIEASVRPDTQLIVMTHASNVFGTVQPIAECGAIARKHGIPFLVDAAQTIGHLPVDLGKLPVDLLAFSGHKGLMGPQGVGGLYIGENVELTPLKEGGTGSSSSNETQPEILPDRYESGTPNTPGLAGLGAAAQFLMSETVEKVRRHIYGVGTTILDGLRSIDDITLYGPESMGHNAGVFSFRPAGADPAVLAARLEERYGIMTRVGLQCSPAAHRMMGTFPEGTVRAGIGYFTTAEEAGHFLRCLAECRA
jgi:cysteine desulfurase/selenocysteine lyase